MFSIDFPEIIIIFCVALVVLGPKKLPGAAAQIGRWVGRARAMARQFREQLEQEVNSVESALDVNKSSEPASRRTPAAQPEPPADHSAAGDDHSAAGERSVTAEHSIGGESSVTAEHSVAGQASVTTESSVGAGHSGAGLDTAADAPPAGPAEGVPAPAPSDEPPVAGMQAWMPETQTWMASAGWEKVSSEPEPAPRDAEPAPRNPAPSPARHEPSSDALAEASGEPRQR